MTLIPTVGIEFKTQTDFMTLLVLSVRDITVVCRLQHQNTPKKHPHTEHVNGFSRGNTQEAKHAKTLLSNVN